MPARAFARLASGHVSPSQDTDGRSPTTRGPSPGAGREGAARCGPALELPVHDRIELPCFRFLDAEFFAQGVGPGLVGQGACGGELRAGARMRRPSMIGQGHFERLARVNFLTLSWWRKDSRSRTAGERLHPHLPAARARGLSLGRGCGHRPFTDSRVTNRLERRPL